jgi:hypothetical protein
LDKYNDVIYVQNSFISQKYYDRCFFIKALYNGDYCQKFDGITADGKEIFLGSIASTYVDLEYVNFQWKVVKVWEDP